MHSRPPLVVHDARTNNLAGVTVEIPSPSLTVVTGVSGSGKSSLVFETIAIESQRQLNEVFPPYIRNRLPRYERPAFERIDNLAPAIVVDQKGIGRNARSTVGTLTETAPMLRVLFSRFGEPSAGESTAYSFNSPEGMCADCDGLGETVVVDIDALLDRSRSLNEGAIRHPAFAVGTNYWKRYATAHRHVDRPAAGALGEPLFDADLPLAEYPPQQWELLLHGGGFQTDRLDDLNNVAVNDYEGVVDRFTRRYVKPGLDSLKARERAHVERLVRTGPCPTCGGSRLSQAVLASRIDGHNIADLSAMQVSELVEVLTRPTAAAASSSTVLEPLVVALRRIEEVGLGYLSLDRSSTTLSGGEGQRLKTVKHLGSSLTGMTYVFDEPSTGLHARDVDRLVTLLRQLRDQGNIVLVVEHDRAVISAADHIVDIGPGAGAWGGRVTFEGTPAGLAASDTRTGAELREPLRRIRAPRTPTGVLPVRGANLHNLCDVDVDFPLGVLTAVTGVAGSGKSSLATAVLPRTHDVVLIDQSAVGLNPRSTPATYAKVWDHVRQRFAAASGRPAGLFSFNAEGACPACRGRGEVTHDMAYLDPVTVVCETCAGRRFSAEALRHTLDGRTVADVLETTVDEAVEGLGADLGDDVLVDRLRPFVDVGLGYLTLGRPLSELSGGERQRVKLASRLTDRGRVFVFDEPTSGLHMADVRNLVGLFDRIVDAGNTVIVIEHDLDVVGVADWVIDMGPGAGSAGGRVVFEGTPDDIVNDSDSLTGRYLAKERS